MTSRMIFSYLSSTLLAIIFLTESPTATARTRHRRQQSCEDNSASAAQQLQQAGFSVNNSQLNACARSGYSRDDVVGQHPKFLSVILKSFARSVCRSSTDPLKLAMSYGSYPDALGDKSYQTVLNQSKKGYQVAGLKPVAGPQAQANANLAQTYALLFGLAGRESDFNFCAGADGSIKYNRKSFEIEAGAFQTSFDVHECLGKYNGNALNALEALESSYAKSSSDDCMGGPGDTPDASTGAHAFRVARRNCPALAVEHAAITVRHCSVHYGTLKRDTVKRYKGCVPLLNSIADQIANDPSLCDGVQLGGAQSSQASIWRNVPTHFAELTSTTTSH